MCWTPEDAWRRLRERLTGCSALPAAERRARTKAVRCCLARLSAEADRWGQAAAGISARVAISRAMKRRGKMWVRAFPHKPISQRPPETRMGHGKGNVEFWAAVVQPGKVLFEVEGVGLQQAKAAFRLAAAKLPVRVRFISRDS